MSHGPSGRGAVVYSVGTQGTGSGPFYAQEKIASGIRDDRNPRRSESGSIFNENSSAAPFVHKAQGARNARLPGGDAALR